MKVAKGTPMTTQATTVANATWKVVRKMRA